MRAPGPWPATSPPLAAAVIVGNRGFRIGGTGKTSHLDASDVFGYPRGLVGLGFAIRQRCLLGQRARVHDHKPERLEGDPPVAILHFHTPHDTLPIPLAWRLLPRTARFFEQQGQGALLRPPRFQFLAHRTRAWDQRDKPQSLLQTQSQRALTGRFALRHHPTHPLKT
jgi:hypothetical protein